MSFVKKGANMNSRTQRTIGWLIAMVGAIALIAPMLRSQVSGSAPASDHFQRSFAIKQNGTLHVDNYKGTIHVTGSDGDQVVVDVTKRFEGGNDSDRKWWMENTEVDFHSDSGRVSVEVKYPQWSCGFCWQGHDFSAQVELEIRVPRQINVNLESYKPDIKPFRDTSNRESLLLQTQKCLLKGGALAPFNAAA